MLGGPPETCAQPVAGAMRVHDCPQVRSEGKGVGGGQGRLESSAWRRT